MPSLARLPEAQVRHPATLHAAGVGSRSALVAGQAQNTAEKGSDSGYRASRGALRAQTAQSMAIRWQILDSLRVKAAGDSAYLHFDHAPVLRAAKAYQCQRTEGSWCLGCRILRQLACCSAKCVLCVTLVKSFYIKTQNKLVGDDAR